MDLESNILQWLMWHKTKPKKKIQYSGTYLNVEYRFIVIAPSFTLTWSGSTS